MPLLHKNVVEKFAQMIRSADGWRDDSFYTMSKLTKRDIVVSISNQTGMVQHQVFDVVQRTLDHITDSLARNVAVELRNFGVFQPRLTKPRVGRNPNQPGSSFVIPPRATVKFKAGKIMRQRVEKLSREMKEAAQRREIRRRGRERRTQLTESKGVAPTRTFPGRSRRELRAKSVEPCRQRSF